MVGILKAGAIIVPVDIAQPTERIELILADAAPALVLVDDPGRASERLGILADRALAIGSPAALAATHPIRPRPTDGSEPAYILYTSGSTGRPKGVVCNHLGICNLVEDRLAERP